MTRTRVDERGQVVEIPPEVLVCGCVYGPRVAVLGYNPQPVRREPLPHLLVSRLPRDDLQRARERAQDR